MVPLQAGQLEGFADVLTEFLRLRTLLIGALRLVAFKPNQIFLAHCVGGVHRSNDRIPINR